VRGIVNFRPQPWIICVQTQTQYAVWSHRAHKNPAIDLQVSIIILKVFWGSTMWKSWNKCSEYYWNILWDHHRILHGKLEKNVLIRAGNYSFGLGILARFSWHCSELSNFKIPREYSSRAA